MVANWRVAQSVPGFDRCGDRSKRVTRSSAAERRSLSVTTPLSIPTHSTRSGADVRYRYTKHSLEQDIILHEDFKLPEGFATENVRLEVWSEWIGSTPDIKETQTIDLRPDAAAGKTNRSRKHG